MKTNMRTPLILSGLFGFAVLAIWLLSRTPAREDKIPAESLPGSPELVRAPETQAPRARLRAQRPTPGPAPEDPYVTQTEPPEDPDEIRQWARKNPGRALAWMMSAAAGPQRDSVAEIACAQVAETDPAQAVALAERYAGGCTNLLENLVYQWSERNEPAARAYALARPAGDERDRLLSRVALTRSKEDPAEAAKLVIESIAPGETQNEAVMSVLHQWALLNPTQALAWAQLFPEGALKTRALKEVENLSGQTVPE